MPYIEIIVHFYTFDMMGIVSLFFAGYSFHVIFKLKTSTHLIFANAMHNLRVHLVFANVCTIYEYINKFIATNNHRVYPSSANGYNEHKRGHHPRQIFAGDLLSATYVKSGF